VYFPCSHKPGGQPQALGASPLPFFFSVGFLLSWLLFIKPLEKASHSITCASECFC
jgi:hypothetical protein